MWDLPLPQQSDVVLRAVIRVCHSYRAPCRGLDYMAADPTMHFAEYMAICALANVDEDEFLAAVHRDLPDDPYPVARLDPDGRMGRRPPAA